MTFWQWTKKQVKRDDPVGDFARDAVADRDFPRRHKNYRVGLRYLRNYGACEGALQSYTRAWKEWRATLTL